MLRQLLDGYDLADAGIFLGAEKAGKIAGWLSGPAVERDEAPLDGYGSVVADVGAMPARVLTIPIMPAPYSLSAADHRAAVDLLTSFLDSWVWYRLDDGVTAREIRALVVEAQLDPVTPGAPSASSGKLVLRCPEPRWRALEPTILALTTARAALVTGSARIDAWVARLMNPGGAVTDPALVIRDRTGEPRTTITLPGTLATTDHLELIAERGLARKWSAGVATTVLTTMTGALVSLLPGDTLALTATSGTPTGELLYHVQDW